MGLFSRNKPKIKVQTTKKDGYSGWVKCTHCNEMIHASELQQNQHCCPKCDHHYRLSAAQRMQLLADADTFVEMFTEFKSLDPLQFVDTESYAVRLALAKKNSGRDEAAMVGTCAVLGKKIAIGILDFTFMAGSMGSVVGERLTSIIEYAFTHGHPLVIVSASGGARMQESALSLMQMAKTSAALAKLSEKKLPYISILTNPTTGGVTASFASLGDIIIAEPDALIGFAGSRVVEQTMREKLPPGAQRSEFLKDKGMVDCIINRHQLKETLFQIVDFLTNNARNFVEGSAMRVLYGQSLGKVPHKLQELIALVSKQESEVR